jgi:hypothetical protein
VVPLPTDDLEPNPLEFANRLEPNPFYRLFPAPN